MENTLISPLAVLLAVPCSASLPGEEAAGQAPAPSKGCGLGLQWLGSWASWRVVTSVCLEVAVPDEDLQPGK